jgi:hypothetical protein
LPDVGQIWSDRASIYSSAIGVMDDLVGVYMGVLPPEFDDFFHEEMHRHVVNAIRLSWDDLASMAGKVFPIYVDADNDTPTAKERAERQERIGYGYNEAGRIVGGVEMSLLMKVYSFWMAGVAEAVAMVLPDYERHTPFFTFRDPRHYYPPVGWSPFNQAAADDALFAYQITVGELKRRYPDRANELDRAFAKGYSGTGPTITSGDETPLYVGEYYHADVWSVETLTDTRVVLERSESGDRGHPGIVPVVSMSLYSPGTRARSIFADQISIQAAMARMFSQKLDYADRSLYPIIFTTPLAEKSVRVGPWAINEWDNTAFQGQPRADVIGPSNPIDFDQTMAFTMGLQRMLNRNPESFQGQAPGGRADSAKALTTLRDSVVNTTIREMLWPPMLHAMPKLYTKAAQLDVKLWPNERKRASGRKKNQAFNLMYRPKVDLEGREEDFQIEPGVGLAGYQGTLEILQLVGAELMDEETALEQGEWTRDAQEAKRRIQAMRMEKLTWADLQAKAAQGQLVPGAMAELRRMVQGEGMDLFDAIAKLEKEGKLTVPPPQPVGPAGAAGGPPFGLPGGAPALPPEAAPISPPPLALLRGGRA